MGGASRRGVGHIQGEWGCCEHADSEVESAGSGPLLEGCVNHSLGSSSPLLCEILSVLQTEIRQLKQVRNSLIWLVGNPVSVWGALSSQPYQEIWARKGPILPQ